MTLSFSIQRGSRSLLAVLAVGLLVSAAGCVSFDPLDLMLPRATDERILPGPPTDGQAVKARFIAVLDDAVTVLGGTWSPGAVGSPDGCGPGEVQHDGYYYTAEWDRTEITDDPKGVTKLLIEHWKERGYKVETGTWSDGTQTVDISSKNGDHYWFRNDNGELTLGGTSNCYPGDWYKIQNIEDDEYERLQSTGAPTPG